MGVGSDRLLQSRRGACRSRGARCRCDRECAGGACPAFDRRDRGAEGTASALNDAGEVVGAAFSATESRAFLWKGGLALPFPSGGVNAAAFGINGTGRIAGAIGGRVARWDAAVPFDLSNNPPGFGRLGSYATSINASGVIAGGATGTFPQAGRPAELP